MSQKTGYDLLSYEREIWQKGIRFIAGIDEAGRGPWAGPVVAAAVIWPEEVPLSGLRDSKALSSKKREEFFDIIRERAISYGIGMVDAEEIDRVNILQATFSAMKKALEQLSVSPEFLLIDGNHRIPGLNIPQRTLIRGDSLSLSVAAAGVLAKVTRDRIMQQIGRKFPKYGFDRHKGYGTREHREKLSILGPTELHRFTFKPVRKKLGEWGEERAVRFLMDSGYKILDRNVRTRFGEVDILAEDRGVIIFIEVKARSSDRFGRGEESVSMYKQRRIVKSAFQIMKKRNLVNKSFRFDVLSIHSENGKRWRMELIKNAFEGGEE